MTAATFSTFTPVMLVRRGMSVAQAGTVAMLGACPLPGDRPESAGVLVVGEVVSLSAAIAAVPRERQGAPVVLPAA